MTIHIKKCSGRTPAMAQAPSQVQKYWTREALQRDARAASAPGQIPRYAAMGYVARTAEGVLIKLGSVRVAKAGHRHLTGAQA